LPNLAQSVGAAGGLSNPVWLPGSQSIAAATNGNGDQTPPHPWLLDVAHDTYEPLSVTGIPVGWMPQQGPLILSTGYQSLVNGGPYNINAVRCATDGQCTETRLTDGAWHYPFVGIVRTA
jgi:hypothetical protein